ncbi:DinB family protein [Paracoccus sp. MA]|uniref:DinB family protein n=1 Tax=Paracoccus sp. MA TaxID=2895796 RepID=UPI001E5E0C3D|nr:DinB family protein [Paracoccus sp. MA]UFM64973.1 DinB family protein [Paracoccus sp. MA]
MTLMLRMLRKLAQMNRLANARLHRACAALPPGAYEAPRPSFFGSIRATLNHILLVDRFYIDALEGRPLDEAAQAEARDCPDLARLSEWQVRMDDRLLALVAALTPDALAEIVAVDRGARVQHDRRDDLLSHLFQHQTHHRGQVHGLLSQAGTVPPQLDEFIVGDDAAVRAEDMARLGWTEDQLMRP